MLSVLAAHPQPRRPRPTLSDRPSVLDPSIAEDPWIKCCEANQRHVLYIQAQPIAMLAALPFDIVSLNIRLHDLRRRRPRAALRLLRCSTCGGAMESGRQLVDRGRNFGGFRLRFFQRQAGA